MQLPDIGEEVVWQDGGTLQDIIETQERWTVTATFWKILLVGTEGPTFLEQKGNFSVEFKTCRILIQMILGAAGARRRRP